MGLWDVVKKVGEVGFELAKEATKEVIDFAKEKSEEIEKLKKEYQEYSDNDLLYICDKKYPHVVDTKYIAALRVLKERGYRNTDDIAIALNSHLENKSDDILLSIIAMNIKDKRINLETIACKALLKKRGWNKEKIEIGYKRYL